MSRVEAVARRRDVATLRSHGFGGSSVAILIASVLGLSAPAAHAQDASGPSARARLQPGATVTVGQPLQLVVEVLVPSFFMGAPAFADLDVPNALVVFNDRGTNFSERVGGATLAGQSRSYTIYPQVAGDYEIDDLAVRVVYRGPSGRTESTISPGSVRFTATIPTEAEGLGYFIATPRLTLTEAYDPAPDTVKEGEAFSRTITATVTDALSMVVPPLSFDSIPGLAVYPDPPTVTDEGGQRSETIVGTRVESVTYVAQETGSYELPALELAWWDVNARRLRRAALPSRSFVVVPNPDLVAEIALPPDSLEEATSDEDASRVDVMAAARRWGPPAVAVLVTLLLGVRLVRRFGPPVRDWWTRRQADRVDSEAARFRRFDKAARSGDARATARTFMSWLDRWWDRPGVATFAAFAEAARDGELERQGRAVGGVVYGPPVPAARWSGSTLAARVARARKEGPRPEGSRQDSLEPLPPLNPG